VKDLVAFVVSSINMERSVAINLNMALKVLFTSMKSDFKKEFSLAFGDYCEVYEGTDNTSKVVGSKVYLLLVYVDDILIVADAEELARLEKEFICMFKWITMSVGPSHSYIGMQISVRGGTITLDMRYYLKKILECCDAPKAAVVTPGGKDTFLVDGASRFLAEVSKKRFHTLVAKLLYLSKRARPDIIAVVGFLCTRVRNPTEEDKRKLSRVLSYLHGSKNQVMKMQPSGIFRVEAFVDASFAAHLDGKSHSGIVIQVGGVSVYFGSRKQKCISKSPTEAELVALSGALGFVELFAEFLGFMMDSTPLKPMIHQDNTSVITMVVEGGGATRTKHMRMRRHLVIEAVKENCVEIAYKNTKDMKVDGLTKTLGGAEFISFRVEVLHLTD
jgi:hypothetical protein